MLLVLDNFEHVLSAAADLAAMCARTQALRVLITSQAPLRVEGEHVMVLDGLPVPQAGHADPQVLLGVPSVALLAQRLERAGTSLDVTADNAEAVAEICRTLDGLPLALELAAARLTLLDPRMLLRELESGLGALGDGRSDVPARQRGMSAALEWTCALLDDRVRDLLADLSVFAGGFTVPLAEAVEGGNVVDGLAALHERSLLRRETDARLVMPPPVRLHAAHLLEISGRAEDVRRRFATALVALSEPFEWDWFRDPSSVLATLDAEAGNLRVGFAWAREHEPELHARLAAATSYWMFITPNHTWGHAEMQRALAFAAGAEPHLRARVLLGYSFGYAVTDSAPDVGDAAVDAWRELGEPAGMLIALGARALIAAWPNTVDGASAGDGRRGIDCALEAREVARSVSEPWLVALAELVYAIALHSARECAAALEVVIPLTRGDPEAYATRAALTTRADVLVALDRPAEALVDYVAYMDTAAEMDMAFQLDGIAMAFSSLGRHREAIMVAALSERYRRMWFVRVPAWLEEVAAALAPSLASLTPPQQDECRAEIDAMALGDAFEWARRTALEVAAADS